MAEEVKKYNTPSTVVSIQNIPKEMADKIMTSDPKPKWVETHAGEVVKSTEFDPTGEYLTEDAIAELQAIIFRIQGLPGDVMAISKINAAIERLQQSK